MWDREGRLLPHVCLCKKRGGQTSFPKGGLRRDSVLEGAMREWFEETGISTDRLQVVQGAHLDEAYLGCRYLLARCEAPSPGSGEPDEEAMIWRPLFEDPADRDPIVQAQWMSLRDVFEGRSTLHPDSAELLQRAEELAYCMELESPLDAVATAAAAAAAAAANEAQLAQRAAAEEEERLHGQEESQRERLREQEQARRVAAHQAQRQEDEALRAGLRAAVEETQREAGEETERPLQQEEALRTAAEEAERLSVEEQAGRVAAEEAE